MFREKRLCEMGENEVALPEYFEWLAGESTVVVAPCCSFGIGYGKVEGATLKLTVNQAGLYSVVIWADRKDELAVEEFSRFGVEYYTESETRPDQSQKGRGRGRGGRS